MSVKSRRKEAYTKLRTLITPSAYNRQGFLLFSAIIGTTLGIGTYYLPEVGNFRVGITLLTTVIVPITTAYNLYLTEDTRIPDITWVMSSVLFGIVFSLPPLLLGLVETEHSLIPLVANLIFSSVCFLAYRDYNCAHRYYIKQGDQEIRWKRAATLMERAKQSWHNGNYYSAHYHYTLAKEVYTDVASQESQDRYVAVAAGYRDACSCFEDACSSTTQEERNQFIELGNSHIRAVNFYLSQRDCVSCGLIEDRCDMYGVNKVDGTWYYCEECFDQPTIGYKKAVERENKRDKEVEQAIEYLGVERPVSIQDVESSFRQLTKEKHPDAGGTQEEFQKLKKYRKILSGVAEDEVES